MAELVRWSGGGGLSFFIKNNEIRGVKELSIQASAETEDTTNGGEKYAKKKNSGSYKINLTAVLNAALGVDVQELALRITECARTGETGYFYTGGSKLLPSMFMAADAKISNLQMTPSGQWRYCEVSWELKQASKYDGTNGTVSGNTGGSGDGGTIKNLSEQNKAVIQGAVQGATATISAAKAASVKALESLTTKKTSTGGTNGLFASLSTSLKLVAVK